MKSLFKRMVNLWSLETAKKDPGNELSMIRAELAKTPGDKIEAMLLKGFHDHFVTEGPNPTSYGLGNLVDFMQWLHDRLGLPTVPGGGVLKPSKAKVERMFAPAVMFIGARVPAEQLAEHLKVYSKKWLPTDNRPHQVTWDVTKNAQAVYFPMTAEEFVSWGCILLEYFHEVCMAGSEDGASEFLHRFTDYAPGRKVGDSGTDQGPAPAKEMHATLYISDDAGATWLDRDFLKLRRSGA